MKRIKCNIKATAEQANLQLLKLEIAFDTAEVLGVPLECTELVIIRTYLACFFFIP